MGESSFDAAEEARKVQHHPEFSLVQNSNRNRLTPKLRQRYEIVRIFVKQQSISEVAKKKGVAYSIIGNFPEQAKLDEIAKYSHYQIQPVVLGDDGTLTLQEVKAPVIKKRFR